MKKLLIVCSAVTLTACSNSTPSIDISDTNSYGLKCSSDPNSAPDWNACTQNAKQICGARQPVNLVQHNPTGSGSRDDGFFLSFQCGQ